MILSGQQRRELQDALIDAFPDTASLDQMLTFELDTNFRAIVGEGSLQDIVFKLIQTATAQGWAQDLVRGAFKRNPGNLRLKTIATELLANNSTTRPYNTSKEDAIAEYRNNFEEFLTDDGEISFIESEILNDLQKKLGLTEEEARAVRDEILKPFGMYQENLDKYRQLFTKFVDEQGYPLDKKAKAELKKLQKYHQLKDEDIALLEKEAEQQTEKLKQRQQEKVLGQGQLDDLSSAIGVNYTKLQNFLKAGQWKEADYETYWLMFYAVGCKEGDWIRDEELLNFPCIDLSTIDNLWLKYSNGLFGFSVQKKIYLEVGGLPDGNYYREAWEKFSDRVGWRVKEKESWIEYDDLIFNTTAPQGHLPSSAPPGCRVGLYGFLECLFSRIETCKL